MKKSIIWFTGINRDEIDRFYAVLIRSGYWVKGVTRKDEKFHEQLGVMIWEDSDEE
jgi:hypothetical protein